MFFGKMGGSKIATVEISLKDYSVLQCTAFSNDVGKYAEQIAVRNQNLVAIFLEKLSANAALVLLTIAICDYLGAFRK